MCFQLVFWFPSFTSRPRPQIAFSHGLNHLAMNCSRPDLAFVDKALELVALNELQKPSLWIKFSSKRKQIAPVDGAYEKRRKFQGILNNCSFSLIDLGSNPGKNPQSAYSEARSHNILALNMLSSEVSRKARHPLSGSGYALSHD